LLPVYKQLNEHKELASEEGGAAPASFLPATNVLGTHVCARHICARGRPLLPACLTCHKCAKHICAWGRLLSPACLACYTWTTHTHVCCAYKHMRGAGHCFLRALCATHGPGHDRLACHWHTPGHIIIILGHKIRPCHRIAGVLACSGLPRPHRSCSCQCQLSYPSASCRP